jgi:hypothetical protein
VAGATTVSVFMIMVSIVILAVGVFLTLECMIMNVIDAIIIWCDNVHDHG